MADQEFTQRLRGAQDPVQRLAGLRVGGSQLPEGRVLLDQADQGLQRDVRVRGQLQAREHRLRVQAFQFGGQPGTARPSPGR